MRDEYDLSGGIKNPYVKKLKQQITIDLDNSVIAYFKTMSENVGIVRLSPFPQYCAPRIEPAAVTARTNIFCTNCTCVASETAVISVCPTRPA